MPELKNNNSDCCSWFCFPCIFSLMVCEKICLIPCFCCANSQPVINNLNTVEIKEDN